MRAEVRRNNGIPEIFLDGEMVSRMCGRAALPGHLAAEKLAQYESAGIRLFLTEMNDYQNPIVWNGRDEYEFRPYELQLERMIRAKPDIALILFVGCPDGSPYLWTLDHPEEMARLDTGDMLNMPSYGSELYNRALAAAVGRFVDHFENSPFADHIAGYNPVYNSNENFNYNLGKTAPEHGWDDYSGVMRQAFRRWLRGRYQDDPESLRASWCEGRTTFDTAEIPTVAERLHATSGVFNCTEGRGRRVADWFRCYNDLNARRALALCRSVKANLRQPKLCGIMQGYSWGGPHMMGYPVEFGSGTAPTILESPDIDFLHSPYSYFNRFVKNNHVGSHLSQHAVEAVHAVGKVLLDQWDSKTRLARPPGSRPPPPGWGFDAQTGLDILDRDFCGSLAHSASFYLQEAGPGHIVSVRGCYLWGPFHFDAPEIRARMPQWRAVADAARAVGARSVAEVALITSNDTLFYRRPDRAFDDLYGIALRHWELPCAGAPVDEYLLEQFDRIPRPYKVYIFWNSFYVPAELREKIRNKLSAEGATALWFYAPGLLDAQGEGMSKMEQLTGIRFGRSDREQFIQVEPDPAHPLTAGLCAYGSEVDPAFYQEGCEWWQFPADRAQFRFAPVFFADDPQAETLGRIRRLGRPGLVRKQVGSVTAWYSAAPAPSAALLREIFRSAGVHLYSERGDVVYANSHFVGVVAATAGSCGAKRCLRGIQRPTHYLLCMRGDLGCPPWRMPPVPYPAPRMLTA
jgi:hypothetical protein